MKTKDQILTVIALLVFSSSLLTAEPLGTAFTYQGQLTDAGRPANGRYDLKFLIYAMPTGGTAFTQPLTNSAVGVTNGLFTVTLDFGGGLFIGEARWLEVHIRTTASPPGVFTPLSQRQLLTPTPQALYAPSAGAAATAGVANAVANNAVTAAGIAPTQVVKSFNGLKDDVTLAAGANITLFTNGNTLQISSAGGSGGTGWNLTGNSSTAPGVNFIGTTDNQALELKVNGSRALRLEPRSWSPNVIGGAPNNSIAADVWGSTIAGGGGRLSPSWNTISAGGAFIGAGYANTILSNGLTATIAGGQGNTNAGPYGTISGGSHNLVGSSSTNAVVGGGFQNTASGVDATVPGGNNNTAAGAWSLAAGRRAKALHAGTFVWTDSTDADFASTAPDQFLIRASRGFEVHGGPVKAAGGLIIETRTNDPPSPVTGRMWLRTDL